MISNDSYGHSTTLTLTNTNSYTGTTTVQGGRGSAGNVSNNVNVLSVATLANGGVNSALGAASSDATNIVLDYSGALKYTGGAVSTNRLFSIGGNYGGMIEASGSGAVNFTNTGVIGFNGSTNSRYLALTGSNTGSNTLAATLTNNTGTTSLTKGGAGTWVLSNTANSYTGVTVVGGGVLNVPLLTNGGVNSSIGAAAKAAGNLVLAGGTLQYTGADAQSTDRLFTIAATGGAIDSSGSGSLTFVNTGTILSSDPTSRSYFTTAVTPLSGVSLAQSSILATDLVAGMTVTGAGGTATAISAVNGPANITLNGTVGTWGSSPTFSFSSVDRTLSLIGSNTGANTIAGILADSPTKKLSLTKDGLGTWILGGVNTYTGSTLVSGGILKAGSASAFGTGVITVSGGVLDLTATNVANIINITGTNASVRLQTSSGALASNFAAGSNLRGWQRQSSLTNTTQAQFLGGTSGAAVATITSTWAASPSPTKIISDVLDLKGTGTTVTFVLQMNYAENAGNDTNAMLGYLQGATWVNAIYGGNYSVTGTGHFVAGAYDGTTLTLGTWGRDTTSNTVWAVVDHNSEFAVVVPEPAALALFALGGLALLRRRRSVTV